MPNARIALNNASVTSETKFWLGATLKEAHGFELSAFGVGFDKAGIAVEAVSAASEAASIGLRAGDLMQSINGVRITDFNSLGLFVKSDAKPTDIIVIREQKTHNMKVH